MTSATIILGFIVYFLLIGSFVYIRTDRKGMQKWLLRQKQLLWGLYGFTSCYLLLLSQMVLKNRIADTVRIVSVFLIVSFISSILCSFLRHYVRKRKEKTGKQDDLANCEQIRQEVSVTQEAIPSLRRECVAIPAFTKKDLLLMITITIFGALTIFFRLGSMTAPQNALTLTTAENKNEVILDFGEETYIQGAYLFLGHMDTRVLAISYFDEKKQEWVLITDSIEAESVYNWNQLAIEQEVRYLGIVSRSGKAVYNELVLLDENQNLILPINSEEYAPLFDEQDLFPKDITYYYRTMFDEVYYARSAYEFLNGMAMYEITHPPLGKILMAIGVALFGVTPFGWRVVCAVSGVLLLPVIYLFVHRLTGKTRYATFATAFVALDFMHLTLSRIATLDSIVALFILAMFCLVYYLLTQIRYQVENRMLRMGVNLWVYTVLGSFVTGAAIATKWTGFYAALGIYLFFVCDMFLMLRKYRKDKETKKFLRRLFWGTQIIFVVLASSIYLFSYIPMSMASGSNLVETMWNNSLFMLSFHEGIIFDHPYSSAWYTWLFDLVPLMDAANVIKDSDKVSIVVTMGNPIIWWGGLGAFVFLLYRACFKRDKKAMYLSGAYLVMLAPWFFIIRTVFIYQYYTCALLLCCMLGYALSYLEKKWKNSGYVFLEASLLCGIIFYPILSGFPFHSASIPVFLQWLERWKFI